MTKSKNKPRVASRATGRKTLKSASQKRSAPALSKSAVSPDTKQAQIIAMLRKPAGATIAAMMAAADWQQHSVRGFLAGIVRKKLGLNLCSEQTDKGRVYWIRDGKPSTSVSDRTR